MKESLESYLDFAVDTAYLAGRLTLGHFQVGVRPDYKADDTPVTVADRRAERLIRQRIAERFPGHAVVGEEYADTGDANASHRWFIDPIDGTKFFICGIPLYAVLLALEIEGRVEVGAVYFPALDEMLAAATGLGCWWNGRRARVSDEKDFSRAVVVYTDVTTFAPYGRAEAWERIQKAAYLCSGWGDAYGHALVATGRAHLMLDPIMDAWDCGPFPPILREAGGYFGDWQGNETIYGQEALSTTRVLLPDVLELIHETGFLNQEDRTSP
ncbi:MAG: inositol monophosphatase family protein [Caldilineae bacterium]|nr:MAG: inositol monophosphatase family protein [Caldilineae bacterium]